MLGRAVVAHDLDAVFLLPETTLPAALQEDLAFGIELGHPADRVRGRPSTPGSPSEALPRLTGGPMPILVPVARVVPMALPDMTLESEEPDKPLISIPLPWLDTIRLPAPADVATDRVLCASGFGSEYRRPCCPEAEN